MPPDPLVRVRFSPSPTGYLHVGGARTVLFNWLYARQRGGEFLLRIEDTDTERNQPELTDNILDMIQWLGLGWDGEVVHQSHRFDRHRDAANRLHATGHAYFCDCTAEETQRRSKERGGPPGYDGFCRDRGLERSDSTALRFRTPDEGKTEFDDVIRGHVAFDNANLEDFVLLRSSGTPTFLLANVVDDADMAITHVIRGEEHVNGTPKYLLIGDALGLDHEPVFAHLPVLVNEARKKLSKRRDSVSVAEFKDAGYLPEAMVNYLALLGWGPPDGVEIRPLVEVLSLFELEAVNPSPAFFDVKKLDHVNGEYIRMLSPLEFVERTRPFLSGGDASAEVLARVGELVRDRVRVLADAEPMIEFLLVHDVEIADDDWDKAVAGVGGASAASDLLDDVMSGYERLAAWEADTLKDVLSGAGDRRELKLAKAQAPVRVATTGRRVGPPLFESLEVLGRDRTLARLRSARERLP